MKTATLKEFVRRILKESDWENKNHSKQIYRAYTDDELICLNYDHWEDEFEVWYKNDIYQLVTDMGGKPNDKMKVIMEWADTPYSRRIQVRKL